MPHRQVLIAGSYYADLIFRDLSQPFQPDTEAFAKAFDFLPGGAFIPAVALHRLGCDVVWAADFGNDLFSGHVLQAVRAEGLDESAFRHHQRPLQNVTVVLSDTHDRAMASYQDQITAEALPTLLHKYRPRVLLLPYLHYGETILAALRTAREMGTYVFMDCQDIPGTLETPTMREVLAHIDVFAPNAAEALRLTGASTLDDAVQTLARYVNTVLIKRGGDGAIGLHNGQRYDISAIPIDVVDTTGAGDCFNAGFVSAHVAGASFADCLAAAVACGAAATTAPGAVNAPSAEELPGWLTQIPHTVLLVDN